MSADWAELARKRLSIETGTLIKDAPESVALVYPSPYRVGMSSLGFQTIYRGINEASGRAAHRAFLPDDLPQAAREGGALRTYEVDRPVADYAILAFSVAYEMELAGLIHCLDLAGLPPLAEEREAHHPFILCGGPLTFSNPLPLAPFADAILMGEADESVHQALDIIFSSSSKEQTLERLAAEIPSCFVPSLHGDDMPPIGKCADGLLPAYSAIMTPDTELSRMFLIEPERGCHRGCTYCVMRRSTNGGMRKVSKERVFELVPEEATKVGLVGAAVTDHPQIQEIIDGLVERGKQVSLSSLRADRLKEPLVQSLKNAGYRTLTTASDGASARLRKAIQRRARDDELLRVAELARQFELERMKVYMMVGLPTEEDGDIDELIEFSTRLSKIIPLSLGIAPFVAKRNTPLDGQPFAGIQTVDKRLKRLRRGVKGRVDLRATSARWAWVEYVLAQGGRAEGRAVLSAVRAGGRFQDWRAAFNSLAEDRPRRRLVIPGDRLSPDGRKTRLPMSS